jgi:hypothetical protein
MSVLNTSSLVSDFDDIGSYLENKVSEVVATIKTGVDDGLSALEKDFHPGFYTDELDFNMSTTLPVVPDVSLQFLLEAIEVYLELDTLLYPLATYTIPLFRSDTPLGLAPGNYGTVGVLFGFDLILYENTEAAETFFATPNGVINGTLTEVDSTHGFHLKLDDAMAVEFEELFSTNISSIDGHEMLDRGIDQLSCVKSVRRHDLDHLDTRNCRLIWCDADFSCNERHGCRQRDTLRDEY